MLAEARDVPLVLVVAPPGYGKTTLLSEWDARDRRPFAWTAPRPGAPTGLLAGIAQALQDAGLVASAGARIGSRGSDAAAVRIARLLEEAAGAGPFVVVADGLAVDAEEAAIVADIALRLPEGVTIALAARRAPRLPIGRLRAQGLAIELGPSELAMTRIEAAQLLDAAGVRADAAEVDALIGRTHGWPAAIALAALGELDDRLVGDYIRTEVLAGLDDAHVAFLRRAAVLSELTGPACDAVLGARGSAATIDVLRHTHLPVCTPREPAGLRLHPLVAEMLRGELARVEPELESELRRRAADWHAARGEPAAALAQSIACHDVRRAGRLLWSIAPAYAARGDGASLEHWLDAFGDRQLSAQPESALAAAVSELAGGRRDAAERWLEAATRAGAGGAAVAVLSACLARRGLNGMAEDARRAFAQSAGEPNAASAAQLLAGVERHLSGDRDAAVPLLEDAARRSGAGAPLIGAHAHAQLALISVEREDWTEAATAAAAARAGLARASMGSPLRALGLAVVAAVDAHRGDFARAGRDAVAARRLVGGLAGFVPWYVAEAQIWLARAEIMLSDAPTARMLLARAARSRAIDDSPVLAAWLHDAWERADAFAAGTVGDGPALTKAELRVLRFLPSHLSFREIGARLQVSTNTVKTQALAVYRKLDVSSRSEAVARGRAIGLLDA
jgi:LuxR family maltose regulon positive regulatory protein